MKALITGASGLLGSHLLGALPPEISCGLGSYYQNKDEDNALHHLDICDRDNVRALMKDFRPDILIHCAGESRVDFVEQNPENGRAQNILGTENMAWDSAFLGTHFVFISSNAVYDGGEAPYRESSVQAPVNEYGWTKSAAEKVVTRYPGKSTIIRPIMLYGWPLTSRRNYLVTRILHALKLGQKYQAADDIYSQPTYAVDCAAAIWKLILSQQTSRASYNVAGEGRQTLYEFALDVATAFGLDKNLITPVKAASFKGLAPRPVDTTYDLKTIHSIGIKLPGAKDGLLRMRAEQEK